MQYFIGVIGMNITKILVSLTCYFYAQGVMARLLGFSERKNKSIEKILAKYKSVNETMNEMRKLKEEMLPNRGRKTQVKLVSEKELVTYLEMGWEIVKELRSGKIVIKREFS